MDLQPVFNIVAGGALAALGWFARTIYAAIKTLEHDLAAHKVEVARDYATNVDVREINQKLDDILRYLRK